MPALANPKHERFALAILQGLSADNRLEAAQSTAYRKAYPTCSEGNPAEAAASRLLRRVKPIMERVRELQAEQLARIQPKLDLSKERVGRRLDLASRIAESESNATAIATSEMGIAKVFGHITDKAEVTQKTDFANALSTEEIGCKLLEQVGMSSPSPSDILLALQANQAFIEQLEAIRDRALSPSN